MLRACEYRGKAALDKLFGVSEAFIAEPFVRNIRRQNA